MIKFAKAPKIIRELLHTTTSPRRGSEQQSKKGLRHIRLVRSRKNGLTINAAAKETKFPGRSIYSRHFRGPRGEQNYLPKPRADSTGTNERRLLKWIKSNFAVMTLNFGSVCILIGFTRSDVFELRTFTMTGQITFAIYNLAQRNVLWPSVIWSTLFSSVNARKIVNICQERFADVPMSQEQKAIFINFFFSHGVTPLQFSWIEGKAEMIYVRKGELLIHKGDIVNRIFLVVKGSTHAHIDGRRLTAASTSPETRGDQLEGGDSGAWIGEMAFLDYVHRRHSVNVSGQGEDTGKQGRGLSLYTIVADDDCEIMAWTHETMEELMEKSSDLRSALVRATTAAVVAKFVNLTIERGDGSSMSWISWLTCWTIEDGSRIMEGSVMSKSQDGSDDTTMDVGLRQAMP